MGLFVMPLFTWAAEGNYPAGSNPWNSQPIRVLPAPDYFTPNQKPPAQFFNYLFGTLASQDLQTLQWTGLDPAQMWLPPVNPQGLWSPLPVTASITNASTTITLSSSQSLFGFTALRFSSEPASVYYNTGTGTGTTFSLTNQIVGATFGANFVEAILTRQDVYDNLLTAAHWDPFGSQWLTAFSSSFGNQNQTLVLASYGLDGDRDWRVVGNITNHGGDQTMAIGHDPVNPLTYYTVTTLSAGSVYITKSIAGGNWNVVKTVTGLGVPGLADTTCFNGYFIAAVSGTSVSHILSTGDHGATWSDTTLGHAVTRWYLSSNPVATTPHALAVPRVYSTGIYFYTVDGHTWVSKTLPSSSTFAVGGLCLTQDAAGICWLMATYDHGNSITKFWRSADGVTWTLQSTGPSGALYSDIADMACCGSLVVCTLADSVSGGPSGTWISPDGGVTWYFGQSGLGASAAIGFATYFQAHILSSGNQFMAYNNIRMRFSDACGLPAIRLA